MRRKVIYPHRCVRSMPLTATRVVMTVLAALGLTLTIYANRGLLLGGHHRIVSALLTAVAVPVSGSTNIETFAPIGTAVVTTTPVFTPASEPWRLVLLFSLAAAGMIAVHRRIPLARSFVLFQAFICVITAVLTLFFPAAQLSSEEFSQLWLRSEVLVWFLLPWLSASLLMVLHPTWFGGLSWAVAMQAYGFLWSAIRLAFCLGVLHYTGLLFMPVLWFTLGLLADVLYVVVFLSLASRVSGLRAWGGRASWQF